MIDYKPKQCAWCGEVFYPQKDTSTTCSQRCAAKLREAKKGKK